VVRGAKSDMAPPLALTKTERKPDGHHAKTQKRFYNVGVSSLKGALYEVLRRADPLARGFCGYPRGFDDEFFRQLTAEKRETKVDKRPDFRARSGARITIATKCWIPRCTRRPRPSDAAGTRERRKAGPRCAPSARR
jgi:phage terminase large subunit GpA-like protein